MRRAALLLPLTLILAACGSHEVRNPQDYELSGTIRGDWGMEKPNLRLQLVGTGFPSGITSDGNQPQNVVPTDEKNTWTFGFELPFSVVGVYQVVVYRDADGSGDYTVGESFARNSQWLIYSPTGGRVEATAFTPELNVQRGWNVYDRATATLRPGPPTQKITGYDLSR